MNLISAAELLALFHGGIAACVDVRSKILDVDALRTFLRFFHPDNRQPDFPGPNLPEKSCDREWRKVVTAHYINRYDSLAAILGQQKKSRFHRFTFPNHSRFVTSQIRCRGS